MSFGCAAEGQVEYELLNTLDPSEGSLVSVSSVVRHKRGTTSCRQENRHFDVAFDTVELERSQSTSDDAGMPVP